MVVAASVVVTVIVTCAAVGIDELVTLTVNASAAIVPAATASAIFDWTTVVSWAAVVAAIAAVTEATFTPVGNAIPEDASGRVMIYSTVTAARRRSCVSCKRLEAAHAADTYITGTLVKFANDSAMNPIANALAQKAVASFTSSPSTPLMLVAVRATAAAVGEGVGKGETEPDGDGDVGVGDGVSGGVVVVVVISETATVWPYGISMLFVSTGTTITEAAPEGIEAPDNAKEYRPVWQQSELTVAVVFCTVPNELPTFVPEASTKCTL